MRTFFLFLIVTVGLVMQTDAMEKGTLFQISFAGGQEAHFTTKQVQSLGLFQDVIKNAPPETQSIKMSLPMTQQAFAEIIKLPQNPSAEVVANKELKKAAHYLQCPQEVQKIFSKKHKCIEPHFESAKKQEARRLKDRMQESDVRAESLKKVNNEEKPSDLFSKILALPADRTKILGAIITHAIKDESTLEGAEKQLNVIAGVNKGLHRLMHEDGGINHFMDKKEQELEKQKKLRKIEFINELFSFKEESDSEEQNEYEEMSNDEIAGIYNLFKQLTESLGSDDEEDNEAHPTSWKKVTLKFPDGELIFDTPEEILRLKQQKRLGKIIKIYEENEEDINDINMNSSLSKSEINALSKACRIPREIELSSKQAFITLMELYNQLPDEQVFIEKAQKLSKEELNAVMRVASIDDAKFSPLLQGKRAPESFSQLWSSPDTMKFLFAITEHMVHDAPNLRKAWQELAHLAQVNKQVRDALYHDHNFLMLNALVTQAEKLEKKCGLPRQSHLDALVCFPKRSIGSNTAETMLRMLQHFQVDFDAKDEHGFTALDYARMNKYAGLEKELMKYMRKQDSPTSTKNPEIITESQITKRGNKYEGYQEALMRHKRESVPQEIPKSMMKETMELLWKHKKPIFIGASTVVASYVMYKYRQVILNLMQNILSKLQTNNALEIVKNVVPQKVTDTIENVSERINLSSYYEQLRNLSKLGSKSWSSKWVDMGSIKTCWFKIERITRGMGTYPLNTPGVQQAHTIFANFFSATTDNGENLVDICQYKAEGIPYRPIVRAALYQIYDGLKNIGKGCINCSQDLINKVGFVESQIKKLKDLSSGDSHTVREYGRLIAPLVEDVENVLVGAKITQNPERINSFYSEAYKVLSKTAEGGKNLIDLCFFKKEGKDAREKILGLLRELF